MKTITINVSEPVYREFKEYARRNDRTTSELIREAMERYRDDWIAGRPSVLSWSARDVGRLISPLGSEDDLLEEMRGD